MCRIVLYLIKKSVISEPADM